MNSDFVMSTHNHTNVMLSANISSIRKFALNVLVVKELAKITYQIARGVCWFSFKMSKRSIF